VFVVGYSSEKDERITELEELVEELEDEKKRRLTAIGKGERCRL